RLRPRRRGRGAGARRVRRARHRLRGARRRRAHARRLRRCHRHRRQRGVDAKQTTGDRMSTQTPNWPRRMESPAGLVFQVNANGSIRRMEHGEVVLNLFPGSEIEGGPTNLYLRRLGAEIAWTPLLGPRSPLVFRIDENGLWAAGDWQGLRVAVALELAQ